MDKELNKFISEYSCIELHKKDKNIFEISRFPHYERVFNNVLAFFLDSSENHNLKNIVYKSFLELLKSKSAKIDLCDEETWWVSREKITENGNYIDIFIKSENYIIGIETKINAKLNNDINDYYNHIYKIAKDGRQTPIFVILSKNHISKNRKNIFNITHEELKKFILNNIDFIDNNKYFYLLNDFLENMNNFYGGSTMNKEFIELLKDEEKAEKLTNIFFNVLEVRKELEIKAKELKNELNVNPKIFKSSKIKPDWTVKICIELAQYFYNKFEFVIEIYIGINDNYEVFLYFRNMEQSIIKFNKKLEKFIRDITSNFYKRFKIQHTDDYDEEYAKFNKKELFELVRCIEENCAKLKSKK